MLTGTGDTIRKARKLRRTMSLPEVLLWQVLRKRPGGIRFRRQHPAGRFILDFACLEARLAIEVDGEIHGLELRRARDETRDEWLMNQGYRTLRISAADILNNLEGAVAFILDQCQPLHQASPGPPPRAGEDF